MSWITETRPRLFLGLARLLSEEPGLVVAIGEPWVGKDKSREWLACLPSSRLPAPAQPPPAVGAAVGAGVQPLERLLAGCSREVEEIFDEVSLDPCGRRAFCGPPDRSTADDPKDASGRMVLDFRNVLLPSERESEEVSSLSPTHRRLAVLCVVVDATVQEPQEVLRVYRRLDQVHCIVAKLLASAAKAEVAPTLQPGACILPSASFSLELMDHEPFGTRGMQEAFPAAMLATLLPQPKRDLLSGVYCARLRGSQECGVLFAAASYRGAPVGATTTAELCFFGCEGSEATAARFLAYEEVQAMTSVGGVLEDVRWLRPFYHGFTRLGTKSLRDLVAADMHAAVRLLWPSTRDATAGAQPMLTIAAPVNYRTPLPLHLLAQEVLSYASTADLGAWALTNRFVGEAALWWLPLALAADVACAAGCDAAAAAAAISSRE